MHSHQSDGLSEQRQPPDGPRSLLRRFLFTSDHRIIGLQYLWLALLSVLLGMVLSVLMRLHLLWPGVDLGFLGDFGRAPERYAALTLLHGSLMVFFVLTAAPQAGFGNYLLPLQIGARETAFPNLNVAAVWAAGLSLVGMVTAFFAGPGTGMTVWVGSVAAFCLASLLVAINLSATVIDLRAKGMTLPRLPVTVWAWFINAILSILIFGILLAACALLLSDGLLGTNFFRAAQGASGASWQKLFWFFAQAEIYVAILPCFGIVTHLLAVFTRRPVWKERAVVLALCGVGVFGFCIWGYHMFATGMSPAAPMFFGMLAASLGIPASILLVSWFATLWKARMRLNTSMLFVLGFISLFVSGGFSGLILSRRDLASVATGDDFITGHFHLVMGVAATFAILAALFYWFPKMFGRRLNERLGKVHFWLTFAGVYCVFMPMHWLGFLEHVHTPLQVAGLRTFISVAALITLAAQLLFFLNFIRSLWRGDEVLEDNPWRATTLEWLSVAPRSARERGAGSRGASDSRPAPPVVYRGAYAFDESGRSDDFIPQYIPPEQIVAPEQVIKTR
jgi:cytochrome c oxidase subunit 1